MKDQIIGYIESGIVIDHISRGKVWKIAEILGVDRQTKGRISLGDGYETKKNGEVKGVIKIEGINLSNKQLNLIALVAENATVNLVKNGKIEKKFQVEIPRLLENIVSCPNFGCISNNSYEQVYSKINYNLNKKIFSCFYCIEEFNGNDLKFVY